MLPAESKSAPNRLLEWFMRQLGTSSITTFMVVFANTSMLQLAEFRIS
jgi:hypothetical protein